MYILLAAGLVAVVGLSLILSKEEKEESRMEKLAGPSAAEKFSWSTFAHGTLPFSIMHPPAVSPRELPGTGALHAVAAFFDGTQGQPSEPIMVIAAEDMEETYGRIYASAEEFINESPPSPEARASKVRVGGVTGLLLSGAENGGTSYSHLLLAKKGRLWNIIFKSDSARAQKMLATFKFLDK